MKDISQAHKPQSPSVIRMRPLSPALGAEISGIDVSQPLDDEQQLLTIDRIKLKYCVT